MVHPTPVPFAGNGRLAEAAQRVGQHYDKWHDDEIVMGIGGPCSQPAAKEHHNQQQQRPVKGMTTTEGRRHIHLYTASV